MTLQLTSGAGRATPIRRQGVGRPSQLTVWIVGLSEIEPRAPAAAVNWLMRLRELGEFELGSHPLGSTWSCPRNCTSDKGFHWFWVVSRTCLWWSQMGTFRLLCCAYVVQAGRACGRSSPLRE